MCDRVTYFDVPVRSTDLDADRVVNNAVYFIYFEQVRLEHFRRLGVIDHRWALPATIRPFAIVATEARFLAPTSFPETLRLAAWIREVRTRSFTVAFRAVRSSDGVTVAEGSSVQVWLDESGASTPLPDAIRATLTVALLPEGDAAASAPRSDRECPRL